MLNRAVMKKITTLPPAVSPLPGKTKIT